MVVPTTTPVTVPVTLEGSGGAGAGGGDVAGVGAGAGCTAGPGDVVQVSLQARSSPSGASIVVRAGVLGNLTAAAVHTQAVQLKAEWGIVGPFNITIPAGAGGNLGAGSGTTAGNGKERKRRSGADDDRGRARVGMFQDSTPVQLVLQAGNPTAALVWLDDVEVLCVSTGTGSG